MATVDDVIRPPLRTMQIIACALIGGVVVFMAIAAVVALSEPAPVNPNADLPILTILAFVLLPAQAGAAFVVQRGMLETGLRRIAQVDLDSDLKQLLMLRQTMMIVMLALFEGAAFVGCMALLIDRRLYAIAVPALALVGMALNFPSETNVRNWLEEKARRVRELRQTR